MLEEKVSEGFSKQSIVFDEINESNDIIVWIRDKARKEVLQHIQTGGSLLELNCGTGLDAVFFAQKGINVLATDNADGMLQVLAQKVSTLGIGDKLQYRKCSFNNLEQIQGKRFDYVFSNFGGLNCTDKLDKVLNDVDKLLKPGGYFTFVIMPVVCPWEILTLFKGKFKTALRRLKKYNVSARVEDVYFTCSYYNPSFVIRHMQPGYDLVSLKGLSSLMPPPYIEHFKQKHPGWFTFLEKAENRLCDKWPFNRWCDHYMITMQKLDDKDRHSNQV